MQRNWILILCLCAFTNVKAQQSSVVLDYINTYSQLAVEEMIRTGVPASITLAQGIHESEAGQSELVLRSNNHFGIKCKSGWTGEKVYHDDDDEGECFRGYPSARDSYMDHSDFLKNSSRYAALFRLDPQDYKGWAYGLKDAGYATNIRYSQLLVKIVEDYNLQQYTLLALNNTDPSILPTETWIQKPAEKSVKPPAANSFFKPLKIYAGDFPSGVFKANRVKMVFAEKGSSVLKLAKRYHVSLAKLIQFNNWPKKIELLEENQLVFLQHPKKKGPRPYHKVENGETTTYIAALEGMMLKSLLELNQLSEEMQPKPGQNLYLQKKAPARPKLVDIVRSTPTQDKTISLPIAKDSILKAQDLISTSVKHVVKSKETLYGIAQLYKTTVENIVEWNKLAGMVLKIGQELIIYKN